MWIPFWVSSLAFVLFVAHLQQLLAYLNLQTRNIRTVSMIYFIQISEMSFKSLLFPKIFSSGATIANKCVRYIIWFGRLLRLDFCLFIVTFHIASFFGCCTVYGLKFYRILTVYFCVVCCHFNIQITMLCASLALSCIPFV